jgi:hypothetical protein
MTSPKLLHPQLASSAVEELNALGFLPSASVDLDCDVTVKRT